MAPGATFTGAAITPAVKVEVRDANGAKVTTSSASVTLTLIGAGTLGGTATRNAAAGVATFAGLTVSACRDTTSSSRPRVRWPRTPPPPSPSPTRRRVPIASRCRWAMPRVASSSGASGTPRRTRPSTQSRSVARFTGPGWAAPPTVSCPTGVAVLYVERDLGGAVRLRLRVRHRRNVPVRMRGPRHGHDGPDRGAVARRPGGA